MRYYLAAVFIMLGFCLSAYGQTGTMGENISLGTTRQAAYHKLSPLLKQLTRQDIRQRREGKLMEKGGKGKEICAFIQISEDGEEVLSNNGCRKLAQAGNIYIASIPIKRIANLSSDPRVKRIEANKSNKILMDSTAMHVNTLPVYEGKALPQAFTGKGVVMGVMDIGFDLTHPNFFDSTLSNYRIKRMWDQISPDTLQSSLYVGRDYTTEEELLAIGRSYDGEEQTHGTHTAGIAAGSGYNSRYRGMAFESDICLVANATSADFPLIDSTLIERYTYAVDALGFKYIFDYADSVGKPCVISFSEGSAQDFFGYDYLYYAMLDSMSGPGRIIVASAGNEGNRISYIHKERGRESAGNFLYSNTDHASGVIKSDKDFTLRLVAYTSRNDTLLIPSQRIIEQVDSEYVDTVYISDVQYIINMAAYPSCYNPAEMCYDYNIQVMGKLGAIQELSLEVVGREADIEVYRYSGYFVTSNRNPALCDGVPEHNIHSPASAPSVICVGATGYRTGITNYLGEYRPFNDGTNGKRSGYSSVGPTMDYRIKPDVMAPGTNVISSYSSYYIEKHPDASDVLSDVEHFDVNGRTYAWNSNTGTSMSTPVVSGAIALWLQAKPDLTPQDILKVFERTCSHYDPTLSYPNNYYGYGQIDVYRGLLDILGIDKIEGISSHQVQRVKCRPADGILYVDIEEEGKKGSMTVSIYATNGILMKQARIDDTAGTHRIDISNLPKGIYAVQVNGGTPSTTGSMLFRQ